MRPLRRATLALTALLVPTLAFGPVVPEAVPDRLPVLSESLYRGELVRTELAPVAPTAKTIDGQISDWVGAPSRIGGTSRYDRGEHIYSDFVHDAWGPDDGEDARRRMVTGPIAAAENRAARLDALSQALGDQFDAPRPVGASDHYGDQDTNDVADITEVRWAASSSEYVDLLVRVANLEDVTDLAIDLRFDRDGDGTDDLLMALGAQGQLHLSVVGDPPPVQLRPEIAVNAAGWTNAFEVRLPTAAVAPDGTMRVRVMAGATEGGLRWGNIAYRYDEPVNGMYNDLEQAFALPTPGRFGEVIRIADLVGGRTEAVRPGPGYHERVFTSHPGISVEGGEDTLWQRYALFVPSAYEPGTPSPLTFWLHYRGGKAHSGGAWSPRLFTQLGEEQGNIVVTPHARGTSKWYEGDSHQDFFEVFEDVHATFEIDPRRRYLSGYSMGGYGTALFGYLYPDLFAAGYIQSAAVSSAQRDLAENGRHFPLWIDHGAQDELVPIVGLQQLSLRLRELGYRYVMTTFLAAEHYTQAIVDEWAGGARYLNRFIAPENPREVTYKTSPALLAAIQDGRGAPASKTFLPDGAWWVDDIVARTLDAPALVDAESRALASDSHSLTPVAGAVAPLDYSTPFVQHGQEWTSTGAAPTSNELVADLTNTKAVSFDVSRLGLDLRGAGAMASITTDGETAVTFEHVPPGFTVSQAGVVIIVIGASGASTANADSVTVTLQGGTHGLVLSAGS